MKDDHSNHSDHDHEDQAQTSQSKFATFIDGLSSRHAFWFGVMIGAEIITFLVLIGIGFYLFNQGDDTKEVEDAKTAVVDEFDPSTVNGNVDMGALTNVKGDGDLTLVEYSDTECPFCKRFHGTLNQVMPEFDGRVRWGYKQFPLTSLHSKAVRESNATECAADQGKFWEYTNEIFARTPSNDGLDDGELFSIADATGLDRGRFDECLNSAQFDAKVQQDLAEAQKLGGRGTPYSLIVNNDGEVLGVISGAQETASVRAQLESLL